MVTIQMDLRGFLETNGEIQFVEVVSYPPLPPRCVRLAGASGNSIYLTTEMREFGDRTEVGLLKVVEEWTKVDQKADVRERFPGGHALAYEYLRPPGFDLISGVRIKFASFDLLILPGDAPYSIYFSHGDIQRGRPEFSLTEYRTDGSNSLA